MTAKRGTSKRGRKKKNTKQAGKSGFMVQEIILWVTLAVCALLLLGTFGLGGFVGRIVAGFMETWFGWLAYLVPLLIFLGVAFIISNRGQKKALAKAAVGLLLFILAAAFLTLTGDKGGRIGRLLTRILTPAVGRIGAYVVVIIAMIICLVILSGKSLLKPLKKQSDKALTRARQDFREQRERAGERARTRDLKRASHHASGVSFDTTLDKTKRSPEAREVFAAPKLSGEASEPAAPAAESTPHFVINRADEDVPTDNEPVPGRKSARAAVSPAELARETDLVAQQTQRGAAANREFKLPPLSLLKKGKKVAADSNQHLSETALRLEEILRNFGVNVTVTNVSCGPAVTRYELQPEMGVKVSKIVSLTDDIKLNLAAADIRIEAPIPGKAAVGIEVPNKTNATVALRDLVESETFRTAKSDIAFAAGKDIAGQIVVADIAKMPHLLIAGATGSGKSVCINTLIISILYKASPEDVKFVMIDPKVVELSVYNGIPNLLIPVVTDPKKAAGALNWAVAEMTRRYKEFADYKVRDMRGYNELAAADTGPDGPQKMPQIVVIVDELADLMMVAPGEVEESICRLAQLARAAGIHLVIATQRPSVNVITGLIKANMPSRIAFSVTSGVDSRTIIDMNGAEKLLGKGDMLFYPQGYQKPVRVQGAFVSDKEVQAVVDYLKQHNTETVYDEEVENHVNTAAVGGNTPLFGEDEANDRDVYFVEAGRLIVDKEKASIGMLQRAFKIGFNRAARIMDQLHEAGVVGGEEGTKPRKILMNQTEFEEYTKDM